MNLIYDSSLKIEYIISATLLYSIPLVDDWFRYYYCYCYYYNNSLTRSGIYIAGSSEIVFRNSSHNDKVSIDVHFIPKYICILSIARQQSVYEGPFFFVCIVVIFAIEYISRPRLKLASCSSYYYPVVVDGNAGSKANICVGVVD